MVPVGSIAPPDARGNWRGRAQRVIFAARRSREIPLIRRTHALALLASVLASASLAHAQVVRGHVREETTRAPVSGAVVTLLGRDARRVNSALTSEEGQFALVAPSPGQYTLEVKRIGVRRVTTPAFSLAAGGTHERDVDVATIPVVQPEVRVSGLSLCGRKLEEGVALAELWEDLRAALTAARVTEQQRLLRVRTSVYARRLDARGERVLSEEREDREGVSASPFASVSPQKLSREGYVDSVGNDVVIYYGPDATVLTSDEFVTDHCFRVIRGEGDQRGWLGVAFEPVPRRRRPDIEGVLWVDAASRELRRIDYAYTHLRSLDSKVPFGGRVEFARMPTGSWIVSKWWIRMPQVAMRAGPMLPGVGRVTEPRVVSVKEDGGEVVSAAARGQTMRLGSRATLRGVVYDSTLRAPLAGARVRIMGTDREARTDSAGRFLLSELADGSYTLGLRHARADSLGAAPIAMSVRLARGEDREVALAIPSIRTIVRSLCPDAADPDSLAVVRGTVRDRAGTPVESARVSLSWEAFSVPTKDVAMVRPTVAETESDSAGAFLFCAARPDHPLVLRATADPDIAAQSQFRARQGGITVKEIVLPMTVRERSGRPEAD